MGQQETLEPQSFFARRSHPLPGNSPRPRRVPPTAPGSCEAFGSMTWPYNRCWLSPNSPSELRNHSQQGADKSHCFWDLEKAKNKRSPKAQGSPNQGPYAKEPSRNLGRSPTYGRLPMGAYNLGCQIEACLWHGFCKCLKAKDQTHANIQQHANKQPKGQKTNQTHTKKQTLSNTTQTQKPKKTTKNTTKTQVFSNKSTR